MSPRIVPFEEAGGLTAAYSTYIDVTVLNSILAGLLILVGALWAFIAFQRLWQQSLGEEARSAIAAAEALGLQRQRPGYGPRVEVRGQLGGQAARLSWVGGIGGPRTVLEVGGRRQRLPFVADAGQLSAALAEILPEISSGR